MKSFLRYYSVKFKPKFLGSERGAVLLTTLVFLGALTLIIGGASKFLALQNQGANLQTAWKQSFEIAEAGANYYRWRLSHDPQNYNSTTTIESDYADPSGSVIGRYRLEITPPDSCSGVVKIQSTGWTLKEPELKRRLQISYSRPSLGQFSFLTNSNVWMGGGSLKGPIHSNGGIRMDADANALISSAKETYQCGPEHGCAWPYEIKPGVWGSGQSGPKGLWKFPAPPIDFNAVTADLAQLKILAQTSGLYLGTSSRQGWHLRFKSDNTVDIYEVYSTKTPYFGWNGQQWVADDNSIETEVFSQNYPLPANCSEANLIFVEDNVWVDGQTGRRVTVAAARFPDTPSTNVSIILNDSFTYSNANAKVALIAQKDVRLPLFSPDILQIDPVVFAQKGHFFRYFYCPPGYFGLPWLDAIYCNVNGSWAVRSEIQRRGAVISNGVAVTTWVNGQGQVISGYASGTNSYDASLTYDPPPFLPSTGEPTFINWQEISPN